ncbi:EFh [Seminavis robusta]|uniref:EFh n=1 Tax=Seminavis robusta TaxID=568900 RepID=A0A9N8HZR8_9STRA|nr:EFh [Seminavis robusta]|eukprot:Sro4018_g352550.1 EFh (209) ;mRNA; r:2849-3475
MENYFGESMGNAQSLSTVGDFAKSQSQHLSMELYESRVASLQRFVAMCVMFHQTGKQVQDFFPKYTFGLMNYNMERTHSIMRIATTASPVSGDAVRGQMERLRLRARYQSAVHVIEGAWATADMQHMKRLKEQWRQNGRRRKSALDVSLSSRLSLQNSTEFGQRSSSGLDDSQSSGRSLLATVAAGAAQERAAEEGGKMSDSDSDISC